MFDRNFFYFLVSLVCYLCLSIADDVLSGLYFALNSFLPRIGSWKFKGKTLFVLYLSFYFCPLKAFHFKISLMQHLVSWYYDVWVRCTTWWVGHLVVNGSTKLVGVELFLFINIHSFELTSGKCGMVIGSGLDLHILLSMIFPSFVFLPMFIPRENIFPRMYSSNIVVTLNPFANVWYSSGMDDSMKWDT